MEDHKTYMQRCLELAKKGIGNVAPNPMVGSVIVHEGIIIGEGHHEKYGKAHAEVNAVNSVANKSLLKEATLYVNLEPCSHHGKTPPCADLILKHNIPRVVIGCIDSHSKVAGKGLQRLKENGIEVIYPILEDESRLLNKRFFTFHEKQRPYVILKWAQTSDGFIDNIRSVEDGKKPLKISNAESSKRVHQWRREEQAIMVGTNTALLDNPQLTIRGLEGNNPLRVVLDKDLQIPETFHLLNGETPTLLFTRKTKASTENLTYITIDFEEAILPHILKELHSRNIQSIIVEGGAQLLNSFINERLWDEARIIVSPATIGSGIKAPDLNIKRAKKETIESDLIYTIEAE